MMTRIVSCLKWVMIMTIVGTGLLLTACSTPTNVSTPAATISAPHIPLSRTSTPSIPNNQPPTELTTPMVSVPPVASKAVNQARADLATRLNVPIYLVQLVSAEEINWPNTGLGCPKPGMMYAQVITPGFKLTFQVDDQLYTYHGDYTGYAFLCEQGQQEP
jgi:hypothetical protein